jgi:hypothetical protein
MADIASFHHSSPLRAPRSDIFLPVNRRLLAIVGALVLTAFISSAASGGDYMGKREFWSVQRHGTNCFNEKVTQDWWDAARHAGIEFVRLAPNKWLTSHRDFLLGNADHFEPDSLVEKDLAQLDAVLDDAQDAGVPVVLTMLSLPGARWRQQNGDKFDLRLWHDSTYWVQSARFWQKLAMHLKDRPDVVGYNILNEPIPEKAVADRTVLNRFYAIVIAFIREVDSSTPIILDGGEWASPTGLAAITPVDDANVLYSFHFYEPWEYTNLNANDGRLTYPGWVILDSGDTVRLDMNYVYRALLPVAQWQDCHGIAENRILLGEFGCNRRCGGAAAYLHDLIGAVQVNHWHWAFYSFREDTWDGMDYELGARPPGAAYWDAKERGENVNLPRDPDNPIWHEITEGLRER